ncbi:hypothetical protein [Streptomyces sp. NPDC059893]|uniref:hypothetical protein n=1 Tax=Streptomyces sp. NPDC059893 TaxID=3346990 RepID=UPI0036694D91
MKPKDHATPKGPAKKPEGAEARPKERAPERESAPEREQGPGRERAPEKDQAPAKDRTAETEKTRAKDKKSEAVPKKKQKEIEGPKPTKSKKPKSPVGKALSMAKGAVKGALKKVGNAAKTLGRKLKKSKLGKALKNGASKLRNFFKKKKDRLRDHKKHQQEQKRRNQDQRKKGEKSKESKEARLQKILARIRPLLQRIMKPGVPRPVMNVTLAGLRLWYRLTGLTLDGAKSGRIMALLNPQGMVLPFHSTDAWTEPPEATKARTDARAAEEAEADRIRERERQERRAAQPEAEADATAAPGQPDSLSPELSNILANPLAGRGQRRRRRGGPVSKGESLTFRRAERAAVTGDKLTPDHIPSGAALIHAAQRRAIAREEARRNTKMDEGEITDFLQKEEFITVNAQGNVGRGPKSRKIYNEALAMMVTGKEHEYRKADPDGGSRTHGSRNTPQQITLDARDLTTAAEDDFRFYLASWQTKRTLLKSQVYSMILHYKRLTDRKEIDYSRSIDNLLLHYWKKARNDTD